jgi:hypothetical protein
MVVYAILLVPWEAYIWEMSPGASHMWRRTFVDQFVWFWLYFTIWRDLEVAGRGLLNALSVLRQRKNACTRHGA